MHFSKSTKLLIQDHVHKVIINEKDGFPASVTLLNFKSGEFYSLDNVGLDFWLFLQETMSLEEIADELISIYDISSEILWKDIEELVNTLIEKDIITIIK